MIMVLVYLIIFIVSIYVIYRVSIWLFDIAYNIQHPDQKHINKKYLKSYLVGKYGRKGNTIYKEIKKVLWRNHRIR